MFKSLLKKIFIFASLFLITLVLMEYVDVTSSPKPQVAGTDSTLLNLSPPDYTTVFSALPNNKSNIVTSVKVADARTELLRQYLNHYNSPLEQYVNLIVQMSDQYDFDYRWMVAIAMQESTLCKFIPENSYNCWGWGIYGDKVTRFESYEDAIRRIAPQFKQIFLKDNHTKDPFKVMKTYTPPSDGSWAEGISQFFTDLQ
ncbi:hypothetical protein HYU91_00590 [Candidatus Collierbacteria bacterium]|nr:hypothetical protein [Candidatus Collierbacteria bacterium]